MTAQYKVCKICHIEWKKGGHIAFYVNDSCHSPDCHMTLDFSIDSHGILEMSFWRKLCWFDDVSGNGTVWTRKYQFELDEIKNEDLRDRIKSFLDSINRFWWRIRTAWIVLFKGWIEVEEAFTFFEKQHVINTIEALKEGLKEMDRIEQAIKKENKTD